MDHAATSGQEIGTAFSRSAALADAAGVSFEMLGAYIATVSERTRQDAGTIGTALNAIMSRLTSVKQKGFNEEDETKVNDVAKALASVNVQLTDGQGEWRRIEDIFMDVAKVWDTLDDKTRNYLATVMAGTRQQNVFRTLMADLSGVATGTSRAMKLYEGAMNSAGTAAEKYAVYQESVTAAHDRMTASLEKLFSLFDSNIMKQLYNVGGGVAEGIYGLLTGEKGHGYDYSNAKSIVESQVDSIKKLRDEYQKLAEDRKAMTKGSAEYNQTNERMSEIIDTLSSQFVPFSRKVKEIGGSFESSSKAVEAMNELLKTTQERMYAIRMLDLGNVIDSQLDDLEKAYGARSGAEAKSSYGDLIYAAGMSMSPNVKGPSDVENYLNRTGKAGADELRTRIIDAVAQVNNRVGLEELFPEGTLERMVQDIINPGGGIQWSDEDLMNWLNMDDFFSAINSIVLNSVDEAQGDIDEAKSKLIDSFVSFGLNKGHADELGTEMQDALEIALETALNGITDEQWAGDKEALKHLGLSIAQQTAESFLENKGVLDDAMNAILDFRDSKDFDVSNKEHQAKLSELITAYSELHEQIFGEKPSSDFFLSLLTPVIQETKEEISEVIEEVEDYSKAVEKLKKEALTAYNEGQGRAFLEAGGLDQIGKTMEQAFIVERGERQVNSFNPNAIKNHSLGFETDKFYEYLARLEEIGIKDEVLGRYDGLMSAVGAYEKNPTLENLLAIRDALREGTSAWSAYKKARDEANSKVVTDQQGAEALSLLSQARNAEELASIFDRELTPAQQEYVVKNSKAYQDLTDGAIDYSTAIKRMRAEAQMINADGLADQGKIWAKTADYLEDARKGGDEYYKTLSSLIGEVDDFTTAQAALNAIQSGQLEPSTDAYTDAMKTLASYTGMTAEYLQDHLGIAAEMLSDDMNLAGDSVGYLIESMFSAANIQFDASNWRAQLMNLANDADFADQRLAQLVMSLLNLDGSTLSVGNDGHVQVNWGQRTYQRSGRSRSSSGSGSRSGSSSRSSSSSPRSSSTNEVTAIQRLVDMMDQVQNLFSYHQSMIQQIQNIYSEKGEFTNLIAVYQEEKDAIAENNKVLEENVQRLEELIPSQQALVAGMSTSDENYKQESEDLKRLQEAHQKYKKELLANVAAQDKLTKAMKDAEKQICQLEMNLENEILQAIEDRNAREERMLQGRIEMENTILDLIKKRYEKERDEIINSANVQINALTEESRLLDEQFNKRKKLADQQDKQAKLQQLEAKLARISADPTRAKEAQTIRQQIADLRDEMAWDTAEAEVQAQQDSIDQQKQSLEDYIDYVEDYYEDLFEHPQKLIEEMKEIISQTDDEILAWLQANNETYANSTEATQTQMVKDWQTTLNDMRGVVETYWDEVEEIIGGGDEAILKFLTENHEGYLTSSEKRQQQYLDDWKELLDDIESAYQRTYDKIQSYDYDTIPIPDASSYSVGGSNSSGSGGYTGGGNPSPSQPSTPAKKTYSGILAYYGPGGLKSKNFSVQATSKDEAHKLFMAEGNRLGSYYQAGSAYAKGGLAYSTGPAWLDGTPNAPERVLSPYQTELFEDLIQTLHEVRVSTNSFGFVPPAMSPNNNSFVFDGDIIVNVETLSDDADYEEVAARVGEVLVRQMSRSGAVGGIATL